jgi:hypothetical protein
VDAHGCLEESAFEGRIDLPPSIILPEGVTSIGEDAFSGCSSLTIITLPEGMTSILERAFRGFDENRDGEIDHGEFSRGLKSLGAELEQQHNHNNILPNPQYYE